MNRLFSISSRISAQSTRSFSTRNDYINVRDELTRLQSRYQEQYEQLRELRREMAQLKDKLWRAERELRLLDKTK